MVSKRPCEKEADPKKGKKDAVKRKKRRRTSVSGVVSMFGRRKKDTLPKHLREKYGNLEDDACTILFGDVADTLRGRTCMCCQKAKTTEYVLIAKKQVPMCSACKL